ncbi:alpha/beta hydrolase [Ameyamaea chiangmaiensis]|uniref:Alpha/beta hydrolase n=2 Tax=Ameyamaea chiangmaiensis TaxID=442969 RepID=A0A850P7V0_9PROT|nr:alpha/beta hydrolase [Ameyamaea chiangmaiensis]NVN40014.1 alpha/beta hydrolase [Ameyamaea chiangmaiensis]
MSATAVSNGAHAQMLAFRDRHRHHEDMSTEQPPGFPIWPGPPPGGGGPVSGEHVSRTGAVTNVAVPTLTVLRPVQPNGAAMLIAGGGGYKQIENGKEAIPAARWLASIGVTAFVLTYRLPKEGWTVGRFAPFQDAERAIRMIRGQARYFGVDPRRVGVMSFSAGAHLLGMETACADQLSYTPIDALDQVSGHPDLTLLIYPIVTLEPPYQDTSTRRVLIGDHPSPTESARWSVQTHIHPGLAPFFLVQAADDPVSNPANTAILQAACEQNGVEVVRHLFPTGGHGFGLGKPGTATVEWPGIAEQWMAGHRFI